MQQRFWSVLSTILLDSFPRERFRVARALETLPLLAGALAQGELSYAKVRALTRVATPETEERLLAVGRAGTAEHVERIVRGWRRVDRIAEAREARRQHVSRALHVYQNEDGMVTIRGRLTPEAGALLMQALAAAPDPAGDTPRAPPSRPRLPLPGLPCSVRSGPSHPSLGQWRPHHAFESRVALSPAPPRRPRRRFPARSTAGRRASVPAPRRPGSARRPVTSGGARRSREDPSSAERCRGAPPERANCDARVAGRAPRCRLGDRRLASARAVDGCVLTIHVGGIVRDAGLSAERLSPRVDVDTKYLAA